MALLADFGNLAKDAHSMQYRLVGLHALQGVAESEILYASDFRKQIEYIVPTLLDDIIDSDITADELDQMLRRVVFSFQQCSAADVSHVQPQV